MTAQITNSARITLNSNKFLCFIYALIIYLPSTALIPASSYYLIAIGVIFLKLFRGDTKFNTIVVLFSCSFLVSLLLSLFGYFGYLFIETYDLTYRDNFIPLQVGLIVSLLIAGTLSRDVVFFIVLFIFIECISGFIQFSLGIKTFFPFVNEVYNEIGASQGLLYFKRVYGFSSNSSGFAGNILVMVTLIAVFLKDTSKYFKWIVFLVAFFALICSFTRSAIIAYTIFLFFYIIYNNKLTPLKGFFISTLFILLMLSLIPSLDWDAIYEQFNRGRSGQDLTGRDIIWSLYIDYINQHPFFGNFSLRNYLYIPIYEYMHAHNSFLMAIYILGIVPSLFIFIPFLLSRVWQYENNIYIIGLLIYSTAQYYIFWGASIADITFFSVLIYSYKLHINNEN
ncbi:O-antigen ligase family protein [Aeromonas encheleia]|uniref:O-antigen ligase family protein n=1 Tax=Aeromonas encheleia TaxID=73010 RepID=A0AAE9MHU7_9GAMM|nr:O-antigen ligase family protein [Aeromonas encheleia]USV58834.1 O-antigen ligase family protein [Aeromonas encheleia]